MANYETRVLSSVNWQNVQNNQTSVHLTFQARRTDYPYHGYSQTGKTCTYLACDGQQAGPFYFNFDWNFGQNIWWTISQWDFTVTHASNGTKSISYSANVFLDVNPGYLEGSGSATLPTIPREASITKWSNTSVQLTSANFSWGANATCDNLQVSLNGGAWASKWSGSASSGTFSQTGLSPGTYYTLKFRVRRKDSQLWRESNAIGFTTKAVPKLTNSSINFSVGSNITLTFNNANNPSSIVMSVVNDSGSWVNVASGSGIQTTSYTWGVSSVASTLYANCKNRMRTSVRVIASTVVGGKTYTSQVNGTLSIPSGNNPTFSNYSYQNTVKGISDLLGSTSYLIQNYGNMQAQISTANKAAAKNSATITKYVGVIKKDNQNVKTVEKAFSSSANVNLDFGTFNSSGAYTINIYAVDSRGLVSGTVQKSFTILPYHVPSISPGIARYNGYEQQITLKLEAYYSKLMIGSAVKNTSFTVKYRYCELGQAMPAGWTTLTGFTNTDSGNDKKVTLTKTQTAPLLTLDMAKTYSFEFVATDSLYSTTVKTQVTQGVGALSIFPNDGLVAVNRAPNYGLTSKANLQVGTDILARKNGTDRLILDDIDTINSNLTAKIRKIEGAYLDLFVISVGKLTWVRISTYPKVTLKSGQSYDMFKISSNTPLYSLYRRINLTPTVGIIFALSSTDGQITITPFGGDIPPSYGINVSEVYVSK